MNTTEANEIRNLIADSFKARPGDLAKSFGLKEDRPNSSFAGESSFDVNGVGLGKRTEKEYFVKLFTEGPLDLDKKALNAQFRVHANDIQIVPIGKITARNFPIRHRVRPASPGASIGHYQVTARVHSDVW